jgi:hypothetical protein
MLAQRLSNRVARTAESQVAVPLTRPCIARQEASYLPSLLSFSLTTKHLSIPHRKGCVLLHRLRRELAAPSTARAIGKRVVWMVWFPVSSVALRALKAERLLSRVFRRSCGPASLPASASQPALRAALTLR